MIVGMNLVVRSSVHYYQGWEKLWKPWDGPIRFPDGFEVSAPDVRPGEFEKHAGKPEEREEDDVEIVWTYDDSRKFRGFSVDAEFTPEGELTTLRLTSSSD